MNERVESRERVFEGRLLKVDVLDVELADGQHAQREVVRHPGAAVVLCQRPDGAWVLVKQFRVAAGCVLLEAVAGTLEPGEAPAVCARREVSEETGYEVTRLVPLGEAYPAPGYTEELLHFFFAEVSQDPGTQQTDEDEYVEVALLQRDQLEELIDRGAMHDAKTLAAWLLFLRRKPEQGRR